MRDRFPQSGFHKGPASVHNTRAFRRPGRKSEKKELFSSSCPQVKLKNKRIFFIKKSKIHISKMSSRGNSSSYALIFFTNFLCLKFLKHALRFFVNGREIIFHHKQSYTYCCLCFELYVTNRHFVYEGLLL